MNRKFWNLFSLDYTRNCALWHHSEANPVIPHTETGMCRRWTANPHILDMGKSRLLYYRGNGANEKNLNENHDRLTVAVLTGTSGDTLLLEQPYLPEPLFDLGEPGSFDCYEILDPTAAFFKGGVWLYYSAIGAGEDSIGAAYSSDGIHFEKRGKIMTGRGPSIIVMNNRLYMAYNVSIGGRYEIRAAISDDGINFYSISDMPICVSLPNSWESFSLTTPRLFLDGDMVYMLYGGSSYLEDEPDYIGIARSSDMLTWEKHPGNPIFGCGPKGSPDGGAIWFPAVYEEAERFVMLYEGSKGKYKWDCSSQICMATIKK